MTDLFGHAKDRIRNTALRSRLMTPEEASMYVQDGATVGCSGFTPAGYPKVIPSAMADRALNGGPKNFTLWTGASVAPELDGRLAEAGAISYRFPYQTGKAIRDAINGGEVGFQDMHLSMTPQNLRYGFYGPMDVAIIEVCAITEEGNLVPTTSVGNSPSFVESAERVIVEVNTSQPEGLEGIHDIFIPEEPPYRKPFHVLKVNDRIGTPYITCPMEKIVAIVPSNVPDHLTPMKEPDPVSRAMARNLMDLLSVEVSSGRLPPGLLPIQAGVGNVANAVIGELVDWPTDDLRIYSEVIQDSMLTLLETGKVQQMSGTAFTNSPEGAKKLLRRLEEIRKKAVLRPQEISNHPEIIRRLGLIAINTALEVDIYGHVNSTVAMGSKMINGIGGSGDFARNAFLSVFLSPSTANGGKISRIVPFCSHVDHTEHDVDVVITEYGVADLRGLVPRERSRLMIEKCAHPDYRAPLMEYLRLGEAKGGHEPHDLASALGWHLNYIEKGTMVPDQ
ncbi:MULTISPECIES: succinate CoA transferase [Dethiosulfovibrio]|uniref:Succinate CoA transferase n=2 Tax=Dethiosulfovibrio TaxID=47054 RepID=A0ABS9EPS2_9BACT|nr:MULTISPECIES: succinate CoA transferase [Dethiosulfovibrio]MCF4114510.1 succinate CoA transferase [Dethiosulfovibrio russensis]MCF4143187.1 succinate CoA transferase [Dethiosulfovibrio marinus]MCF4145781.1 succinate CoA transferase [Dethiosulfovibrio acidaminovorans]